MPAKFLCSVLIAMLVASCGAGRIIEATYCVAIGAHGMEQTDAVSERLSNFGVRMGLKPNVRDKLVQNYESKEGLFDIGVSFGMGEFGAIVTFFPSVPGAGESVLTALKQMIATEIEPKFKVTRCGDIEGFKTPTLYKPMQ